MKSIASPAIFHQIVFTLALGGSMKRVELLLCFLCATTPGIARGQAFPVPRNSELAKSSRMDPQAAAKAFQTPQGFRVSVFAAEPDIRNPIAMAWDPKGRLWVAENYTYAEQPLSFDLAHRDRVLIFDDTDGDGRFDRRTVFTEDVQRLTSVEVGLGGAWLFCPPRLLFVPDKNQDDRPDGAAEVILDGFTVPKDNYHNFANGLHWGPDGWLYGRCGASSPGQIGAPGTPESARIPIRGGIWRYHPPTKRFEVLTHGTTNPWGHDWNSLGEAFFINTVNGHLWHVIPGAHLVRPHTIEPNSRVYAPIDQHADHWHWDHSRPLKFGPAGAGADSLGGGHAHSGMTIYLGNQWPPAYRDKLLTLNFHGRRVNVERLERDGSGYAGRHEPDMLFAADPWFRGIELGYGPDGGVFMLDWSDTGECHEHDGVHRGSGRIFKVTHGEVTKVGGIDLGRLSETELVERHKDANEWHVRQARRVLLDRAARGETLTQAREQLYGILKTDSDVVHQLRALWTLHAIGGVEPALLRRLLDHDHEAVRVWSVRLLTDDMPIDTVLSQRPTGERELASDVYEKFCEMASSDRSALVRLALASTLQRLPVAQRPRLAGGLLSHAEDNSDHNLPSLIWTGLIPVADRDPGGLAKLATLAKMPSVIEMISRRLAEDIATAPAPLNTLLAEAGTASPEYTLAVVNGMAATLKGWRKAPRPDGWELVKGRALSIGNDQLRGQIQDLDVLFGDGRALAEVRRLALDDKTALDARKAALRALIEARPPDLKAVCEKLIRVRYLNAIAINGLVLYDDPGVASTLAQSYRSFHFTERGQLIATLVSRPTFARALLDQIAAGKIPRDTLTAFDARQILSLGDATLSRQLASVWGEVRQSSADRRSRIAQLKEQLDPQTLARADRGHGRAIYQQTCAKCHRLHGEGGEIGPDLTGSGRSNLDYLLENIVDPSSTVTADFRMMVVQMQDGRILNGMIKGNTPRTFTLQTQNEAVTLDRREVEAVSPSTSSLMPDGLLDSLKPEDIRDLLGYLSHPTQVPLAISASDRP